ncbi:MAG: BLUF domain-containing protein [Xanthomonadales bacterium]
MYRLIYKSRASQRIDWDFVNEVLGTSEQNNREAGITGVLLASDTHFLQVLEGDFDAINRLFMRIARDPRHEDVELISFGCVESRLFGGWTMHAIGIFEFNRELLDDLIEQYGEEDGSVRFPVEEWKVLALISDLRRG